MEYNNNEEYKNNLNRFKELCNKDPDDYKTKKEKEFQYYKNEIKDNLMLYLKENNNNICIDGKKLILSECNNKSLDVKKIKEEHPDLYYENTKIIHYKKIIFKKGDCLS